jgi:hypothetical protein
MEQVEWLASNQNYWKGLEILKNSDPKNPLLPLLESGESSFTASKLEQAIKALQPSTKPAEPQKKTYPPKVIEMIRKRSMLHSGLPHITSKSDRFKAAAQIVNLTKKLDQYFVHGILEGEEELPKCAWDLHLLINANSSFISKNQKNESKAGEVNKRKEQNELIEVKLKSMTS